VDDDNIEGRRLARTLFDHTLELGPAVVHGGSAGLDECFDQLKTARCAIASLPFLIGNGDIVLGLPGCRHAQIEHRARCSRSFLP
jgi:hypothetical protein